MRKTQSRPLRFIGAGVVALLVGLLGWGALVGTHTDYIPATSPLVGHPFAVATSAGCPIPTGSDLAPDGIAVPHALLTAPGSYGSTIQEYGGTMREMRLTPLPRGGKLRVTRRWFRPDSYAYVVSGRAAIPLTDARLPIASSCR